MNGDSTPDTTGRPPQGVRRALVVGATSSIGASVVRALLAAGMEVLATGRHPVAPASAQAGLHWLSLDLADPASIDRFCAETVAPIGPVDIVVSLAGILPGKALSAYDDALAHDVMTVNFTAQAMLLRRLLPHLSDGALILLMSSISAERGSFDPIYAASKAAQIAFVKSLATWLAPGIRINAIAPGLIAESTMHDAMTPERRAHHAGQTPTRRLTSADEIAGVIVDLCGPAWANLNGQVVRLNGGAHV